MKALRIIQLFLLIGGASEKDESVLLYPVFMIKVALMSPAEQKRK